MSILLIANKMKPITIGGRETEDIGLGTRIAMTHFQANVPGDLDHFPRGGIGVLTGSSAIKMEVCPMTNVLRTPYAVVPRLMIAKFVEIGVLRDKDRNDAAAVERALAVIRQRTFEVLAGCVDE
jgi:hypothetical protein